MKKALLWPNIPRYGYFSKIKMKVHEQSFSFFPSSVFSIGLRRTIWCESLNMIYLSLAKRSLLGCQMQVQCWEDNGFEFKGLSLLVFLPPRGRGSHLGVWSLQCFKVSEESTSTSFTTHLFHCWLLQKIPNTLILRGRPMFLQCRLEEGNLGAGW